MEKVSFRITDIPRDALLRLARSNGQGFPPFVEYIGRSQRDKKTVDLGPVEITIRAEATDVEIVIANRRGAPAVRAQLPPRRPAA